MVGMTSPRFRTDMWGWGNCPTTPPGLLHPVLPDLLYSWKKHQENLPDGWKVDIIPDGWKEEQLAEGCKDVKGQQRNVKCELVKLLMLISMGTIVLFNDKQHSYMKDGKKVWILLTDGSADSGWRSSRHPWRPHLLHINERRVNIMSHI